jgi:glycosyltransferase involved in cell wall biosynthesis
MRVALFTTPSFIDLELETLRHLSDVVDVDLYVEVGPESWTAGVLGADLSSVPEGLYDAKELLRGRVEPAVLSIMERAMTATVVAHRHGSSDPRSQRLSAAALRRVRQAGAEVLHMDEPSLRSAAALRWGPAIPVCVTVHDPVAHSGERSWRRSVSRALSFGVVDRFILRSRYTYGEMEQLGYPRERIAYVPLGPYDIYREMGDANPDAARGPRVLFFGRLSAYKGIDVLLEAAPLVCERVRGVEFVLAGRAVLDYEIPSFPPLANGGRITALLAHVANKDVAGLFKSANTCLRGERARWCPSGTLWPWRSAWWSFSPTATCVSHAREGLPIFEKGRCHGPG